MEKVNFRFLRKGDSIYLKKEDVIEYLLEIAGAEETDVQNRLEKAARNIGKIG